MYTLEVTCSKQPTNPVVFCLRITELLKEKKICHLKLRYTVVNGKLTSLEKPQALKRRWREHPVGEFGRGLLMFFLDTHKVCSTEWTDFWFLQKNTATSMEYRMYDCSERFLELNVKAYSLK